MSPVTRNRAQRQPVWAGVPYERGRKPRHAGTPVQKVKRPWAKQGPGAGPMPATDPDVLTHMAYLLPVRPLPRLGLHNWPTCTNNPNSVLFQSDFRILTAGNRNMSFQIKEYFCLFAIYLYIIKDTLARKQQTVLDIDSCGISYGKLESVILSTNRLFHPHLRWLTLSQGLEILNILWTIQLETIKNVSIFL